MRIASNSESANEIHRVRCSPMGCDLFSRRSRCRLVGKSAFSRLSRIRSAKSLKRPMTSFSPSVSTASRWNSANAASSRVPRKRRHAYRLSRTAHDCLRHFQLQVAPSPFLHFLESLRRRRQATQAAVLPQAMQQSPRTERENPRCFRPVPTQNWRDLILLYLGTET